MLFKASIELLSLQGHEQPIVESSAISCNTEHTSDTCRHEVGMAKGRFELKRQKSDSGEVSEPNLSGIKAS